MNYLKKNELKRRQMKQIDYRPTSPILVDGDYNILFGNSLYDALPEEVSCIVLKDEFNFLLFDLWKLEQLLTKEMICDMDFAYQELLKKTEEEPEQPLLFDFDKHTEFLTEQNYVQPIVFSKTRNKEKIINEDFFSYC